MYRHFGLRRVPCLARLTCCAAHINIKTEYDADIPSVCSRHTAVLATDFAHMGVLPYIHSRIHAESSKEDSAVIPGRSRSDRPEQEV